VRTTDDAEVIRSLELDSFVGREGQTFVFRRMVEAVPGTPAELVLELVEVTPHGPEPGPDAGDLARRTFSLLLRASAADPILATGMHQMVHAELPSCSLLISPVQLSPRDRQVDDSCTYYEVVFG
jgi:hypothetical protein